MRNDFANKLFELAKKDKDVVLIIGDLGYGVMNKFWEELPSQFINAGIAEQNMLSVAAGLGVEGKTVFVYSIANFPTLRALEQIRNSVCYHDSNVKIVSIGSGFAYGSLGMSHHGTEDMAIMRALPNMRVLCPCDKFESIVATEYAYKNKGAFHIRLAKGGEPDIHTKPLKFDGVSANKICSGKNKNTVLFVTGAIASEALQANIELAKNNLDVDVYSFLSIKPIDEKLIKECAKKYTNIVTLEEHNLLGGFGSAVAEVLAPLGSGVKLKAMGIKDTYSAIVGDVTYLRERYGLSAKHIVEIVEGLK